MSDQGKAVVKILHSLLFSYRAISMLYPVYPYSRCMRADFRTWENHTNKSVRRSISKDIWFKEDQMHVQGRVCRGSTQKKSLYCYRYVDQAEGSQFAPGLNSAASVASSTSISWRIGCWKESSLWVAFLGLFFSILLLLNRNPPWILSPYHLLDGLRWI